MAAPEDEPENLSKPVAKAKVREITQNSSCVLFTSHALERMKQRDVTTRHVMNVLRKGHIYDDPIWNNKHQNWSVNILQRTAGAEIEIVAAIDWPSKLMVVTVIRRKS
ncbi:MAG: DUF4258 domain-containing protein [Pseudomonadota bacterium]